MAAELTVVQAAMTAAALEEETMGDVEAMGAMEAVVTAAVKVGRMAKEVEAAAVVARA